tara:strand:+ start:4186 stop:4431 length:246 start_codon:yes stop_codon:yes gene_type:complete
MIRNAKIEDAKELVNIYNYYVKNTSKTFDCEPLSIESFEGKINTITSKLYENFGFEKVAHFKEVCRKFDQWYDVAFWQLTL